MPPETENFWLLPTNQQKAEVEKAQNKDLRVWEKPTAASRYGATSTLRDSELPMAPMPPEMQKKLDKMKVLEREVPSDLFLATIATRPAVGVVEPLRKEGGDLRSYVARKREVFLVQMALDVKRAEAANLEEAARKKEEALQKSQQMLDEDTKKFQEFLQERYSKAQKAAKDAEDNAKRKQEKVQRIKQIRQEQAFVASEIAKLRESREENLKYKAFLEELTPNEWKEQQKQLKLDRKAKRKQAFISRGLEPLMQKIADDEMLAHQESLQDKGGGDESHSKKRGKLARVAEEEQAQREKERQIRRKKLEKRRIEEERRLEKDFVDFSSEEEPELYFKEPVELMDKFTELEEKNLSLIQLTQETEQQLDELEHNFEYNRKRMSGKVQQLNDHIRSLQANIAQERKTRDTLAKSLEEKAGTHIQDKKLEDLMIKVQEVYKHCGMASEQIPDVLLMLGAIESTLEELIQGLDVAFTQDEELVKRLEKLKLKERSERVRILKNKEQTDKQEERLINSLLRSQAPVFKKAGKQVMYRSPPLRKEFKVVKSNSDDEKNVQDHKVFGMYIDRKTQMPITEAPIIEEPKNTKRLSGGRLFSAGAIERDEAQSFVFAASAADF